ncbi:site-specific integrase [Bacillus piscicola]|uniref:site-specific integrase n=1 Tax=Bacillus piscicola TaxID=1632684 RepID=UPI001F08CA05|nr:site-specific integrase [Bacillus piscicola]
MGRRGKASIVHQTKTAINAIDRIGESKKEAREAGDVGIHSIKQKKETMSAAQNFAKWVREHHWVKSLYQLKESHYRAYIANMQERGLSNGHIRNVETALRHLQKGMEKRAEKFGKEPVSFCAPWRIVQEADKPKDRSYTQKEYEQIARALPPHSHDAVMLSRELGLRVREACNVRVEHFTSRDDGGLKLSIERGAGITKGGRFREVPVPAHVEKEVHRMMEGKKPDDSLVSVKPDTVRRAVNRAAKDEGIKQLGRGMHGFRHLYARDRVSELLEQRGVREQGSQLLERMFENMDQGRYVDYGIHGKEELFAELKAVVDRVHSELGHGSDRWDLARIYIRR